MKISLVSLVIWAFLLYKTNGQNSVCKKENGYFPHEDYCDYYYECIDGQAFVQACPNGLAFAGGGRGLISNCDYAHRVGCPNEQTGKVMGQSPQGSGHCPWLYGIFPHEKSCTKYWHCWNGTGTVQVCPFSLLYNEVKHACDWPNQVTGCQQHPLCKGNPNGVTPIQESCLGYWLCLGGFPQLQKCPAGLAFNIDEQRCDLANDVPGCEPVLVLNTEDEEELRIPTSRRRTSSPTEEAARTN